jgi:hypothetical protein
MLAVDLDLQRALGVRAIRGNLLRLKWHAAALRFELALRRHDRELKAGYDPTEPRNPIGADGAGRWTDRPGGNIPTNNLPEAPEERPTVPKEMPKTSSERTAVLKAVARWVARYGGPVGTLIEVGSWAYNRTPFVQAYNDPPKSLEELHAGVSTPELGYDIHHIVEQTQAARDGFPREAIDGPENLVRIPAMKHWEINGWYQRENPDFGGQSPREYLAGRNWDVRRSVGLEALRIAGVLKP